MITFELFDGGKPVSSWILNPDGSGEYRLATAIAGKAGYQLITRKVAAGKSGYRDIASLVGPAWMFVEGRVKCGDYVADKPRGTIAWTDRKGAKAIGQFDMGCQLTGSKFLISMLAKADQRMRTWSAHGPVIKEGASQ